MFRIGSLICLQLLLVDVAWAFVQSRTNTGEVVSWNERCIPFHVNQLGSDDIDFDTLLSTIQNSLDTWSSVDCSGQSLVYEGITDSDFIGFDLYGVNINMIMFRETKETWQHSRNVIALTTVVFCEEVRGDCRRVGQLMNADLEFNGAYHRFSASTPVPTNRFDFENTLTHELGHLLGFDHSADPDATMFASAPEGESLKRSLADDDISGICTVYPIEEPLPECAPFEVTGDYFPGPGAPVGPAPGVENYQTVGCDCGIESLTRSTEPSLAILMLGLVLCALRSRRRTGEFPDS